MKQLILSVALVTSFSSFADCGLRGPVSKRIKDCSYQKSGFALVTSKGSIKVYKELSTGLLWSDSLSSPMGFRHAESACRSGIKEVAGVPAPHGWRLPTKWEYEQAERHGIRQVLPNMNDIFWSTRAGNSRDVWVFSGQMGRIGSVDSRGGSELSVRCVSGSGYLFLN